MLWRLKWIYTLEIQSSVCSVYWLCRRAWETKCRSRIMKTCNVACRAWETKCRSRIMKTCIVACRAWETKCRSRIMKICSVACRVFFYWIPLVLYCFFQDIICWRITLEHLRLEGGNGHSNESQRFKSGDSDWTNKMFPYRLWIRSA